ncbi:MAG: radical SAM protein [Oscillospiraceae bacterium]
MSHRNIAFFVPHRGCPHTCAFCNQHSISGQAACPTAEDVRKGCEQALREIPAAHYGETELAFFGGSFTAIDQIYMVELLTAAREFVGGGKFAGIRISTRPDCIDGEILDLLKSFGVTVIELGAQSLNDTVLAANGRGHTAANVRHAAKLVQDAGFTLGLQMMTGLYQSSPALDMETARGIAALAPDEVRIYPCVVLKNTRLAELLTAGAFVPQGVDEAAALCADMLDLFEQRGIRILKVGLHASELVESDLLGGAYHPAFREICESLRYRKLLEKEFTNCESGIAAVPMNKLSAAIGHKACNRDYFAAKSIRIHFVPQPGAERELKVLLRKPMRENQL